MKEKFMRFMNGRYGMDSFGRTLLISSLILYLLSMFTHQGFLYWVALCLLVYTYYRMFSRDLYRRASENQVYLTKTAKLRHYLNTKLAYLKQLKAYHIYKCPTCKQKIRIPRGKGRIEIRCPKCQSTFVKNS